MAINPSESSAAVRLGRGGDKAQRGDKSQRILDAAVAVIAEKGYWQARVAEIADRAGVADGTIYLYYKNKEQLLMAAIDSAFDSFLERARRELAEIPQPKQRLHRLAFLHLDMLGANRNLAIVFQTELRHSAKFLAQFSRHRLVEYFDMIRSIVREGQKTGEFRAEVSDKIAANCLFGALDEMVTSWMLSEHEYPLAGAADAVVEVVLGGLETQRSEANGSGRR